MKKKGLIVGINYVGTGNDLRGCLNDASNMKVLLQQRGFDEMKLVLEKDATTAGIKAGLAWLVADTTPGDVILFHYSGHGSQLPSKTEKDGFEEIICPIDLNWTTRVITDQDLRTVFDAVPKGVNTTLVLDCCHSGDALNQDEGDSVQTITKDAPAARDIGPGSRYLTPPDNVVSALQDRALVQWSAQRDVNDSALLVAGCHSNQTSADAFIDGVPQGAATAALIRSVKANPKITYKQLIDEMTTFMVQGGYAQRPELDGFSGLHGEIFGEPFGSGDAASPAPVAPAPAAPAAPAPVPTQPEEPIVADEGQAKMMMIVAAAAVILGLLYFLFK